MGIQPSSDSTQSLIENYFSALNQTFCSITGDGVGVYDRWVSIAGYTIHLKFAGSGLAKKLSRALQHLEKESPGALADLTILLFDSTSTGVYPPPPPWNSEDYAARGIICGFNTSRYFTHFQGVANSLSMLDMQQNKGVFWLQDLNQMPLWVYSAPLLNIFHHWFREHGYQVLHAGAVGSSEGGVLLIGKGGSGKSTLALSCLSSELKYLSDDYCLVQNKKQFYIQSLYSSGKKSLDDLDRLSFLKSFFCQNDIHDSEKSVLFVNEYNPESIITAFPLRAVLIPKIVVRNNSRLVSTNKKNGITSLAPSTIFQLPGSDSRDFTNMSQIIHSVPCYTLEVGRDISQPAEIISQLLKTRGTQ